MNNKKQEMAGKMKDVLSKGQVWSIGKNDKYASMGDSQKTMRKTFDTARKNRNSK